MDNRIFSLRGVVERFSRARHGFRGSHVEFPDQIDKTALIRNSRIRGRVRVGRHSMVSHAEISGTVTIGRWSTFNGPNSDIWAMVNPVEIGNFCSIARNVSIQEYGHVPERLTTYFIQAHLFGESMRRDIVSKGGIVIGNDVWVGTQCVILSGARVSDGVVIGANSVVESDIPPYAIAVGSPARVVKYRFPDRIIERLLALQWWNWDDDTIRRNRRLFDAPITEGLLDQLP